MTITPGRSKGPDAAPPSGGIGSIPVPGTTPVMTYAGALRVYFNRLSAEPMMWCVSPEDAAWEIAVRLVTFGAGASAVTVYQPKPTPDDEDGRPSAWLAAHGLLSIFPDGTATITKS